MENCTDVWGGRAWFEPNLWHHAAVTVSGAADICIYWDGQPQVLPIVLSRAEVQALLTAVREPRFRTCPHVHVFMPPP